MSRFENLARCFLIMSRILSEGVAVDSVLLLSYSLLRYLGRLASGLSRFGFLLDMILVIFLAYENVAPLRQSDINFRAYSDRVIRGVYS